MPDAAVDAFDRDDLAADPITAIPSLPEEKAPTHRRPFGKQAALARIQANGRPNDRDVEAIDGGSQRLCARRIPHPRHANRSRGLDSQRFGRLPSDAGHSEEDAPRPRTAGDSGEQEADEDAAGESDAHAPLESAREDFGQTLGDRPSARGLPPARSVRRTPGPGAAREGPARHCPARRLTQHCLALRGPTRQNGDRGNPRRALRQDKRTPSGLKPVRRVQSPAAEGAGRRSSHVFPHPLLNIRSTNRIGGGSDTFQTKHAPPRRAAAPAAF